MSAAVMLLFFSCASLSSTGVGRVKRYTVCSEFLPDSFDGYKLAFISDTHYPSLFTRARLGRLVRKLRAEEPSILLLGGDYVTDDSCIDELLDSLSAVAFEDGLYAVLGNHERKNATIVADAMERYGIDLLCNEVVSIEQGGSSIRLVGIENSFVYDTVLADSLGRVGGSDFTILLCHTPDYAERTSFDADLVLSGHTHGGQVSLFGIYTPVRNSSYGTRFLRGKNRGYNGADVITTNGVGTSRRKVRFCVPSEIVMVTLRKQSM